MGAQARKGGGLMRLAAQREWAALGLRWKGCITEVADVLDVGTEREEPRLTPRVFWPEQPGGRCYHLLSWETLDEEWVGYGKNILSSVLDTLNLRC